MAGSIPNMDKGILATVEAHVKGQTVDATGGYFTSMSIAGGAIAPSLDSKVKGPTSALKCAAFFTHLYIENNTILSVELLVDTTTVNNVNAAGTLSSMVGKPQPRISFTGMVGAYRTTGEDGGGDVLKQANIQGQIWRSKEGILYLKDLGETTFGTSHMLQMFQIGILPDKSTDLQLNFGGQANGVWTFGPLAS